MLVRQFFGWWVLVVVLLASVPTVGARDWIFRIVKDEFAIHNDDCTASLNDAGVVVFDRGYYGDEDVIYRYDGAAAQVLVDASGQFRRLWNPLVNDDGLVAFCARLDDYMYDAVYATADGVTFAPIVHPDDPVRNVAGLSISNDGAAAFWAQLDDYYTMGIYVTDGVDIITIAENAGPLALWGYYGRFTTINDERRVAFWAEFDEGGAGIFVGDGTTLETIATTGDLFDQFHGSPVIDAAGQVYFLAELTTSEKAIYRWDGEELVAVIEPGGPWGDLGYGQPWANDEGRVLFETGSTWALYVGPEPDAFRVIGQTDTFYGGGVSEVTPLGLNAGGQVLFHVGLQGGRWVDVLAVATPATGASEVIYVRADADGLNDGTSWEDAFMYLWDALEFACPEDQIWVAAGVYKPGQATLVNWTYRGEYFGIPSGMSLYGGFAGDEATLEERAGLFDQTVLSGDINGDDEPNFANYDDNCYVVVVAGDGEAGAILIDGFTIRGGSTGDGFSYAELTGVYGAGLSIRTEATIRNCVFVENQSDHYYEHCAGAGVHAEIGPAVFENCEFANNRALKLSGAGGAYVTGVSASFADCIFHGNSAPAGGAGLAVNDGADANVTQCVFDSNANPAVGVVNADATIGACTFTNNTGTALRVWGSSDQAVTVTDCTFVANSGVWSGAVDNVGTLTLRECLFLENEGSCGGAVGNDDGTIWIENCEFLQNAANNIGYPPNRGGAFWTRSGEATVKNCTFVGNWATPDGAGGAVRAIYDEGDAVRLVNCQFWGNSADIGGAVACYDAAPVFAQCVFAGNTATDGGAFHSFVGSEPVIVNSVIVANSATGYGGGLFGDAEQDQPAIHNSILWANQDQDGNYAETSQTYGGEPEIRYSCVSGWTGALGGIGNFGDDPLFVDQLGPDGIPGSGDEDFRLSPGSPCIDRGSDWLVPEDFADLDEDTNVDEFLPLDLEGEGRFFDDPNTPDVGGGSVAIVDVGAYEFGGTGPQPCLSDFDGDGDVDLADLGRLLGCYGSAYGEPEYDPLCDVNVDGVIGLADLATLLGMYQAVCP